MVFGTCVVATAVALVAVVSALCGVIVTINAMVTVEFKQNVVENAVAQFVQAVAGILVLGVFKRGSVAIDYKGATDVVSLMLRFSFKFSF